MNPLEALAKEFPKQFKIPPPCFEMMKGEILEWKQGESLKVRFPVLESYQNPAGLTQGGFIAAMVDNTFGPFSFLEAKKPTTSLEMDFSYTRPVTKDVKELVVMAVLKEHSKNYLIMHAEVLAGDKVVTYATTRMMIFS